MLRILRLPQTSTIGEVKIGVQETDAEHEMEMKMEMKSLSPGKAEGGTKLVCEVVSQLE